MKTQKHAANTPARAARSLSHAMERDDHAIDDATIPNRPDAPLEPSSAAAAPEGLVVTLPTLAHEPLASPERSHASEATARAHVQVAPNVLDLVTLPIATPEETRQRQAQRDLNEIVHSVLVLGLIVSVACMLIGIGLDLLYRREIPTAVPDFGDIFTRVRALRPSGFIALGLLVLIATPILRVIGSIGAFLYERDWRYAGITGLVFIILMVSLVLGKG